MGDPATLKNFLEYGEKNYPAAHKVFVFRDHGGLQGVCIDEIFTPAPNGRMWETPPDQWHILSFDDIHQAFDDFYKEFPQSVPFELVAFDTCLSGSYECVKSLEGFTRYVMASETTTFGGTVNYTPWLEEFVKDTKTDGKKLGEYICNYTKASYSLNSAAQTNFAVIDMSKLPAVTKAQDEFFAAAVKRGSVDRSFYSSFAQIAASNGTEHYENIYVDLGRLTQNAQGILPEAKNLLDAVNNAVCCNLPANPHNGGTGLSTFYPYNRNKKSEFDSQNTALQNQKTF